MFDKEQVEVEVSDIKTGLFFRMRIGNFMTDWTKHYFGILILRSQKTDRLYGFATAYWNGYLPIEEPFLITLGKKLS